jgi:NAD-dependent deacetylase
VAREIGLHREAARAIVSRRRVAVLTGAGVSVDSGIPAFRGTQGLWARYDPFEYASLGAFLRDPGKVWRMLGEMMEILSRARPNPAHTALAELESMGLVAGVVTQNIDGLHQAAGSRRVIEYHGNPGELLCLSCGNRYPSVERIASAGIPPRCGCGEVLKPDVVFFGEAIPAGAMEEAEELARSCGTFIVAGTSAQVSPACDLPRIARDAGAYVIEINPEATQLTGTVTDLFIGEGAGSALPQIVREAQALGGRAVKEKE